jgi:hypothetical protein
LIVDDERDVFYVLALGENDAFHIVFDRTSASAIDDPSQSRPHKAHFSFRQWQIDSPIEMNPNA